jgi:uncharacterized protein YcnI
MSADVLVALPAGRAPPERPAVRRDRSRPRPTRTKEHQTTMHRTTVARAAVLAAAAALAVPALAGAHVTANPAEVPAQGYGKVDFRVPHGCDGSPTTRITVRFPDEVVDGTPQVVPGWRIATKEGRLAAPVEAHGETQTEGVREVS